VNVNIAENQKQMRLHNNNSILLYSALALYVSTASCCSHHGRRKKSIFRPVHVSLDHHCSFSELPSSQSSSIILSVPGGGSSPTPQNVALKKVQQQQAVAVSSRDSEKKTSFTMDNWKGIVHIFRSLGFGALAGIANYQFASRFPFLVMAKEAKATYIPAYYSYDPQESRFCASAWTYVTDYVLGAQMIYLAHKILKGASSVSSTSKSLSPVDNRTSVRLKHLGSALMSMYAVQFTVAGILHQFMGSFESRNTMVFRILWTVVVTMVSASGGVIGAFASELAREGLHLRHVPSDWFWIGYTTLVTAITFSGIMSYQRPAVDTFIAGTSQAGSTFFLVGIVALMGSMNRRSNGEAKNKFLSMLDTTQCIVGFLMNGFLLPVYTLALYHTNISIPQLNTTMHSWLFICYTLQGLSLSKIVNVFAARQKQS